MNSPTDLLNLKRARIADPVHPKWAARMDFVFCAAVKCNGTIRRKGGVYVCFFILDRLDRCWRFNKVEADRRKKIEQIRRKRKNVQ